VRTGTYRQLFHPVVFTQDTHIFHLHAFSLN
jgi:hypothetical protein